MSSNLYLFSNDALCIYCLYGQKKQLEFLSPYWPCVSGSKITGDLGKLLLAEKMYQKIHRRLSSVKHLRCSAAYLCLVCLCQRQSHYDEQGALSLFDIIVGASRGSRPDTQ